MLVTLLTYRKTKMEIAGRRKEQFIDNMKYVAKQRAMKAAAKEAQGGEK